jgi:hypothetical protein
VYAVAATVRENHENYIKSQYEKPRESVDLVSPSVATGLFYWPIMGGIRAVKEITPERFISL